MSKRPMQSIRPCAIRCASFFCLILLCAASLPSQTARDNAWKVIHDGIKDTNAAHREQAVSALGVINNNAESLKLAEGALDDASNHVREAAVTALGEMDAKESVPRIKGLLKTGDAHMVVAIAAVLRKFNDPEAYEIYYEIVTGKRKGNGGILDGLKDKKTLEHMGIEEGLGFVPYASIGIGAYNYFKANSAAAVEAKAASELALDPDPAAEKALVQAAYGAKDVVKLAALRALAKRGDPAVVSDIEHHIYGDRNIVTFTAAAAVVHLTDPPAKKPSNPRPPRSPRSTHTAT